jgi:PTH1 family peptidyl-tRNA hydrolase
MRLIAGLGNPGRKYQNTPHNIGFEILDELAARHSLNWVQGRYQVEGEVARGTIAGADSVLVKPTTYMNLSGQAIAPLVRHEGLDTNRDLLVIVDDVALPLGRLRLRASGSSGGHRGLESLFSSLQSRKFARLRCGVETEAKKHFGDLADYVLARWTKADSPEVDSMTLRAADAAEDWLRAEDIAEVMTRYNAQ